ncbi:PulJ/GspJ family protein [Dielma fastidiosa]|uniref:Prepilin-type N-terminal cleavage/methylation domain-containing protein n=1 Tax=Dielma fastidiosa TaxID=1034346 RepID=A0AB35UIW0_9FIRM|nr:prepilin-type N-terminal cleavage/methylation domain-containing protein [Dielma fastidiosa]MDY5166558.1 prepilin-type N-terminal cleavage/methylation domain-containing protein [Dielma fastidiosa]
MKKGFTLVEILTAVALLVVIGLFMATGYLTMIRLNQQTIIDRRSLHESSELFAHKNLTSLSPLNNIMSITFSIKGETVSKKVNGYVDEKTGLIYYELKPEVWE